MPYALSWMGIGVQSGSRSLGDSQRQENAPAASTPFALCAANKIFEEYLVWMICSANAAAIANSLQNSSTHPVEVMSTPNLIETVPIFAAKVGHNPIEFTKAMERVADLSRWRSQLIVSMATLLRFSGKAGRHTAEIAPLHCSPEEPVSARRTT